MVDHKGSGNDDALLKALTLVLTTNGEYAKSVAALLDSDLEKAESLENMSVQLEELTTSTKKLIESQETLTEVLSSLSEDNKTFIKKSMENKNTELKVFINDKFESLFEKNGLKKDGSDYTPGDKLIINAKNAFFSALWALAGGGILLGLVKLYALLKK